MLKPVHHVSCAPALAACQQLIRRFAQWLCDPATTAAHLTQPGLQPPVLSSNIEADWLWNFLQGKVSKKPLLERAKLLASMTAPEKAALLVWIQSVSDLAAQFLPAPTAWPIASPLADEAKWSAFGDLMEALYEKGFRSGLPYLPDGSPVAKGGVSYADFVSAFRTRHRLTTDPNAREVCVLCGGPLGDTPHVDHWIIKSSFPLLSVCPDNLAVICSVCNEAPNKGFKKAYSDDGFSDWFHPYLRPGYGHLKPIYLLKEHVVRCEATTTADQPKANNLDLLLNLGVRWTRELKAEYLNRQNVLRRREERRLRNAMARHTEAEIEAYVMEWQGDLVPTEPHHEVHQALAAAMLEPARLAALRDEVASVTVP